MDILGFIGPSQMIKQYTQPIELRGQVEVGQQELGSWIYRQRSLIFPYTTSTKDVMLKLRLGFKHRGVSDVIRDMAVRFILNCPKEDLATSERLFFQIEEAHWFYDDFAREENPQLPKLSFPAFVKLLFAAVPCLSVWCASPDDSLRVFRSYKSSIPVRGAIILTGDMKWVLLVRGWESKSWGYPKGKINKDEPDVDCAIREVKEEVGFDISPYIVPTDWVEAKLYGRIVRLYVVRGIPRETIFKTETRKEISEIKWHQVSKLPQIYKGRPDDEVNKQNARTMRNVGKFSEGLIKYIEAHDKGMPTGPFVEPQIEQETDTEISLEYSELSGPNGWELSQLQVPPVQYIPDFSMPMYDAAQPYYFAQQQQHQSIPSVYGTSTYENIYPMNVSANNETDSKQPEARSRSVNAPLLPSQTLLAELMGKSKTSEPPRRTNSSPSATSKSNSSVLLDCLRKPPTPEWDGTKADGSRSINRLLLHLNQKSPAPAVTATPSVSPKKNTLMGLLDDELFGRKSRSVAASPAPAKRNALADLLVHPLDAPTSAAAPAVQKRNNLADLLIDSAKKAETSKATQPLSKRNLLSDLLLDGTEKEDPFKTALNDMADATKEGLSTLTTTASDNTSVKPRKNNLADLLFETAEKEQPKAIVPPPNHNNLADLLFDTAKKEQQIPKTVKSPEPEPKHNNLADILFEMAKSEKPNANLAPAQEVLAGSKKNDLASLLFDNSASEQQMPKIESKQPVGVATPKKNILADLLVDSTCPEIYHTGHQASNDFASRPSQNSLVDILFGSTGAEESIKEKTGAMTGVTSKPEINSSAHSKDNKSAPAEAKIETSPNSAQGKRSNSLKNLLFDDTQPRRDGNSSGAKSGIDVHSVTPRAPKLSKNFAELLFDEAAKQYHSDEKDSRKAGANDVTNLSSGDMLGSVPTSGEKTNRYYSANPLGSLLDGQAENPPSQSQLRSTPPAAAATEAAATTKSSRPPAADSSKETLAREAGTPSSGNSLQEGDSKAHIKTDVDWLASEIERLSHIGTRQEQDANILQLMEDFMVKREGEVIAQGKPPTVVQDIDINLFAKQLYKVGLENQKPLLANYIVPLKNAEPKSKRKQGGKKRSRSKKASSSSNSSGSGASSRSSSSGSGIEEILTDFANMDLKPEDKTAVNSSLQDQNGHQECSIEDFEQPLVGIASEAASEKEDFLPERPGNRRKTPAECLFTADELNEMMRSSGPSVQPGSGSVVRAPAPSRFQTTDSGAPAGKKDTEAVQGVKPALPPSPPAASSSVSKNESHNVKPHIRGEVRANKLSHLLSETTLEADYTKMDTRPNKPTGPLTDMSSNAKPVMPVNTKEQTVAKYTELVGLNTSISTSTSKSDVTTESKAVASQAKHIHTITGSSKNNTYKPAFIGKEARNIRESYETERRANWESNKLAEFVQDSRSQDDETYQPRADRLEGSATTALKTGGGKSKNRGRKRKQASSSIEMGLVETIEASGGVGGDAEHETNFERRESRFKPGCLLERTPSEDDLAALIGLPRLVSVESPASTDAPSPPCTQEPPSNLPAPRRAVDLFHDLLGGA